MSYSLTNNELEARFLNVMTRLGFVPDPIKDEKYLMQVPYWGNILELSKNYPGGLSGLISKCASNGRFLNVTVPLPSLEQKLVGSTIAHQGKVLELSEPGTRKTISSLSAIVPIEEMLPSVSLGKQNKVKTFITCPGYIVPVWMKQIENLFVNPNIVIVTKENREHAIKKAQDPQTSFVIVGYDMTFRNVSLPGNGESRSIPISPEERFRLSREYKTPQNVLTALETYVSQTKMASLRKRNLPITSLIDLLGSSMAEEVERQEMTQVIDALRAKAFPDGSYWYSIVDEFHNLVGTDAKRSEAISKMVRPARWAALLSGTGIGNTPDGLAWSAYATGFVDDPQVFKKWLNSQDALNRVRAYISLKAAHPIRTLSDIDPLVKKPISQTLRYDISAAEVKLFDALVDSDFFEGREKYLIFRALLTNPLKLLPENLEHLNHGNDPLPARMNSFFSTHPGLEDEVRNSPRSKMEYVVDLVKQHRERGEKVIIACDYQRDITTELEKMILEEGIGVRRVDQTIPADVREVKLTKEIVLKLKQLLKNNPGIFTGKERFLSDLSPNARNILGISQHQIYAMSPRECVLNEYATNPDITALVATRNVLREGVEMKEATQIISFEDTTVPVKESQFNARTVRTGQREQVKIWNLRCSIPEIADIEEYILQRRESKERTIKEVFYKCSKTLDKDVRSWLKDYEEDEELQNFFAQLGARKLISEHFKNMVGTGSQSYHDALMIANNARFIASLYNKNWANTYSGSIAKLGRDIVKGIEIRKGLSIDDIVDAASGPLALAQLLGRHTTAIDMNRFQLAYGVDAIHDKCLPQSTCFMGDITNMKTLIPFDRGDVEIFDPSKVYSGVESLKDESNDLVLGSLVFHLLDSEGKAKFVKEANRVLRDGRYMTLIMPTSKVDVSCRDSLLSGISTYGFEVSEYFTGTYQGRLEQKDDGTREVEAYVIVAQKTGLPSAQNAPLILKPNYKIVDGSTSETRKVKTKKNIDSSVDAHYFLKVENGLDLRHVTIEDGKLREKIEDLSKRANSDGITKALDSIKYILGGQK